MKRVTPKLLTWLILILLICACQPNTDISNIYVEVASPTRSVINMEEEIEIDNCEGATDISRTLGDVATVSKELRENNVATTKSGVEYQLPEFTKLLLEQKIESAYEQTYQTEVAKIEKTTLEVAPNKHIIFIIEKEKLTFSKIVKFTIHKDVYENAYVYEMIRPKIRWSEFIKCPDKIEQVVSPTLTLIPETHKDWPATLKQSPFLYRGPNMDYGEAYNKELNIGETVWVIAKNDGADWFLVETNQGHQGWLYIVWIDFDFDISLIRTETSIPPPMPTSTARPRIEKPTSYPNP